MFFKPIISQMFIPDFLLKLADNSPEGRVWLESLPQLVKQLTKDWNLKLGHPFLENVSCSYVAPCLVNGTEEAVLKIGWPHEEALHEIEGLKLLNGEPTAQLLNFDKETNSMLLERCLPGTHLKAMPALAQDEIICQLLTKIWNANYSGEPFRPLATMVAQWNKETYENLALFPDPNLAKEGCNLKEVLIQSTEKQVLLATDLHAGNILKARRKEWLAIDIKPYCGDRTYDLTQHLLNGIKRLTAQPKETINRVANLAGVNNSRLKDWMFARLASENNGIYQKLALRLKRAEC